MKKLNLKHILIILTFAFMSNMQKCYAQEEFYIYGKYKNKTGCILTISKNDISSNFNFDLTCKNGPCEGFENSGIAEQTGIDSAEAIDAELSSTINFDLEENKIVFNAPADYLIPMKCEMNFDTTFVKIIDK